MDERLNIDTISSFVDLLLETGVVERTYVVALDKVRFEI